MPVIDSDTGKEFVPYPVTPPEEIGPKTAETVLKVGTRAGLQTAGAELGAAVGALGGPAAPITVPAGAAIGGGIANVAGAKLLPPDLGGDPSESTLGAFAFGAVPEAAARGVVGAIEKRALNRAAESAHTKIVEALDKGPMPAEQAGQIASAIGRPSLIGKPILTGERLTDATNSLRKDILDPITATRRRLGEPIGRAYDALKGNDLRIDEQGATDLADAAQGVRDGLISPASKAGPIFAKIKRFAPPPKLPPISDSDLFRLSPAEQQARIDAEEAIKNYKPPTLDDLRELRQQVNSQLRSASGGDVHALAGLQQALDEQLLPHLPPGIDRDRELYRGFIQRFPWRDIQKLNQAGTPRELSKYVFGGTPERAAEIIEGSSPKGHRALAEALKDHALDSVNPDAPLDQQVAQVQKVLSPYVANGTAAKLFGAQGANELREVFYAPVHRAQMAKLIAQPEQKEAFIKATSQAIKSGGKAQELAVERGFSKLVNSLPPAERAQFIHAPVPGADLPVLPSTGEAMQGGFRPGPSKLPQRMANRATFTGPYAVGRAAMGSPGFAAANLAAMAGIAATSAGYRAIMENGGASTLAHLYASPSGRAAARATIEMLAAIGTQSVNQASK